MAYIGGSGQNPYQFNGPQGNHQIGPNPGYTPSISQPQQLSPYQFLGMISTVLKALDQLMKGWGGWQQPRPFPQPFPPPYQGGPVQPPIQALYGVAIGGGGPIGGGPVQPPIQALYGVAIGGGGPIVGGPIQPPIQALYGVAIGGGGGFFEPPIQALYGVALGR